MGLILIAGDEGGVVESLKILLNDGKMELQMCHSGQEALAALETSICDMFIVDLGLGGGEGLSLVERGVALDPDVPILALAHEGSIREGIAAANAGAADYFPQPINPKRFQQTIYRVIEAEGSESAGLTSIVKLSHEFECAGVVAESPVMQTLCEKIKFLGPSSIPICLLGEPRGGKRAVAEALHQAGPQKNKAFEVFSPRDDEQRFLFGESEDSGKRRNKGLSLIEKAVDGTLYIKHAESLSEPNQKKIMQLMKERRIYVEGSDEDRIVDVRFVFSFSIPVEDAVAQGMISDDFFNCVTVMPLYLPTLSERNEDVLSLVHLMLCEKDRGAVSKEYTISSVGAEMLERYNWPGGFKELSSVVDKHMNTQQSQLISADNLPLEIYEYKATGVASTGAKGSYAYRNLIDFLRDHQTKALHKLVRMPVNLS